MAIATLIALVGSACGLSEESSGTSSGGPATGDGGSTEPLVIGAVLPLTGPSSETGLYIRDGYEDWAKHLNEQGGVLGRQIEIKIVDDTSDPARSSGLLEKLITEDGVDLLLGGYATPAGAAQMPIAEQHQKVYVGMGGGLNSFQQGFEYSFGAPPLVAEWWYKGFFDWLETVPEADRPTKAALVTVNNPLGSGFRDGALEDLEAAGIEVVVDERYDLPLANAQPLITKARDAGADLFIANSQFDDGVQLVRAAKALRYQPKAFLEGIGTLIPNWKEELGNEGDFIFSGTAMHADLPFPGVDTLNEMSMERYGIDKAPTYYMFGATWLDVLVKAIEGANSVADDDIRDWLASNSVESLGGPMTFDETGKPEPYSYLIQVQDGVAELIWPADVAQSEPVFPQP